MRTTIQSVIIMIVLVFPFTSHADPAVDQLSTCLVDSLNGKERKSLAKWIFFSMAAHPEIAEYSRVTPEDRYASDKFVGKVFTRLLVEDCLKEVVYAASQNPQAIEKSFELVGEVAMYELMQNDGVMSALENYVNHISQEDMAIINQTQ